MKKQTFYLETILSITTGVLFTEMSNVYKILNFMTNDNLWTHQLPRAYKECMPWILRQHPELKGIDVSDVNTNNWKEKLEELKKQHKRVFVIEQIPRDDHDYKNPIEELEEMVGKDRVIPIKLDE